MRGKIIELDGKHGELKSGTEHYHFFRSDAYEGVQVGDVVDFTPVTDGLFQGSGCFDLKLIQKA